MQPTKHFERADAAKARDIIDLDRREAVDRDARVIFADELHQILVPFDFQLRMDAALK